MAELRQLTELALRAAQVEMTAVAARESHCLQQLSSLTDQSKMRQIPDGGDAALIAGADWRWHRWVDQRRAVINQELAQLRVQRAVCAERLRRAFGRDTALQASLDAHKRAAALIARRRDHYES